MTTSEPTTGNIAEALRVCFEKICACSECPFEHESCGDLERLAADRLESQDQTIAELMVTCETMHQEMQAMIDCHKPNLDKIAALTARAEQAERERDAAKADMKLIVEAVRETHCDETCCFACKFDCDTSINDSGEFNNECPGFDRDDCFEWRGLPQDGEESR